MASLRELQREFAAALRSSDTEDSRHPLAVQPRGNLAVYRHNSRHQFGRALEIAYPVIRRRVGDDYFRQLVHHYREAHPSRSGDLHWAGREFAAFLDGYLAATEYRWLADLARLEWSCEQASIAEFKPPVGAEVLAEFDASELEHLTFGLQPSMFLLESPFPVFSVWQVNQLENAPPVDQFAVSERGIIHYRDDGPVVRSLPAPLFSYSSALAKGATLGEAMSHAGMDEAGLLSGLQLLFAERLVCSVRLARGQPRA
jgi:hypothetical protein